MDAWRVKDKSTTCRIIAIIKIRKPRKTDARCLSISPVPTTVCLKTNWPYFCRFESTNYESNWFLFCLYCLAARRGAWSLFLSTTKQDRVNSQYTYKCTEIDAAELTVTYYWLYTRQSQESRLIVLPEEEKEERRLCKTIREVHLERQ